MKAFLLNPPMEEHPINRDMAGGLGHKGGESMLLPPMDLALLASRLIAVGWEVELLDAPAMGSNDAEILDRVRSFSPDVTLGLVSLSTLDSDCKTLQRIRDVGVPMVLARTGVTFPPLVEEILRKSRADAVLIGEVDLCLERVVAREERRGTAWLEDGSVRMGNPLFVSNLDDLPLPARALLMGGVYFYSLLGTGVTTMQTTRGCPYSCAYYCPYPLVQGSKWRHRSPAHVLKEITDCVENHGVDRILFRDATFTIDKRRVHAICSGILERRYPVTWWCETRVDCLDRPLMEAMKKSGCKGISVGVETGDEEVMQSQAKTGLTLAKLREFRRAARELDLHVHFLLMVGLPEEKRKSIFQTYELVRDLEPESMGVTVITPFPGTPIYEEAKAKGWIETEDWSLYDQGGAIMHTDNLSREEMNEGRALLYRGFFLGKERGPWGWLRRRRHERAFRAWSQH